MCKDIDECLKLIKIDKKSAVGISREHAFSTSFVSDENMFCFPTSDNIYTFSISMLATRDFHLLPKINEVIRSILEAGLFRKWQTESRRINLNHNEEDDVENSNGGSYVALSMNHIEGAFYLGLVGIALSTLVFIGEIIHFKLMNKKVKILKKI